MKKKFIIPLIAFMFSVGCSGNRQKEHQANEHEHTEHHDHESHIATSSTVQLDNGEKWEANPETNEGIENMLTLVHDQQPRKNPNPEALKEDLTVEFNTILQKCTMTGEAHNQLHNYLLPLKEKIDQLGESNSGEQIEDIENYLKTYKNHFK